MSKVVVEIEKWARRNALSVTSALKQLGVSTNIFYRWKHGGVPQMGTLHRLAQHLGVDPELLVDPVNPSTPDALAVPASAQSHPAGDVVLLSLRRSAFNELGPVLKRYGALVFSASDAGGAGVVPELLTSSPLANPEAA